METKDLVLLMLIPIILISLILYTDKNPTITGAIITKQEESNIIGVYSIMPSFKAKIDYNLEKDYKDIKEKLDKIIEDCKNRFDIEQCFTDQSNKLGWNCEESQEEAADILYDFVEKFKGCTELEEDGIVCRFSLDEREITKLIGIFVILLTNENQKTKVELRHGTNIWTEYINLENLFYTVYDYKDTLNEKLNSIRIIIEYVDKKPIIKDVVGVDDNSNTVPLSKTLLLYKKDNNIKFVEAPGSSFEAPIPANKIIYSPKTKGFKFCAKTNSKFYAYDESDKTVKLRDVVYRFAVTYPIQSIPPKPIENLEAFDTLKAENSIILTWDKSNENIKSFSIYYSTKDFIDAKIDEAKKDNTISKKYVLNKPIELIKDIDFKNCNFNPIGTPCKYSLYGSTLKSDKLYYWSSKNKFIYLINDVKDDIEYNFAVTAVNEENVELNNDKSIKDNIYVLTLDKNYKKFTSKDDLAPDKVLNLNVQSIQGKIKLTWNKPEKNIDGSASVDITGFNIYYKKSQLTQFPELEKIDTTYIKKPITAAEANCGILVDISCEYTLEGLGQGEIYNLAITAIDKVLNEFTYNADIKQLVAS